MKNIFILFFLFLFTTAIIAQNANITLTVKGIEEIKGDMSVALYKNADDFPGNENYVHAENVPIETLQFSYVIKDIPPGTYAIAIYHDLDKNRELNKNWIGMPKEPFGFSNDAKGKMGPPSFEDSSFALKEDMEVVINLKSL